MYRKFKHLNIPDGWEQYWSKYPNGYTILEGIIDWVSQVDDMVDNVNNWNEYLANFVATFDKELQQTVTDTLSDWQQTGFLDVVISEALQWELDEFKATTEQNFLSVNQQLQQTVKVVNVKAFGAVGDEVIDDTESFNNAITTLNDGDTLHVPHGNYKTTELLIIDKDVNIDMIGTIKYYGQGLCLQINTPNGQNYSFDKKMTIKIENKNFTTRPDGVVLYNVLSSQIYLNVQNFNIGVKTIGYDSGFAYNDIYPSRVVGNKINLQLVADGLSGWVNQNTYFGGSLGWLSTQPVDVNYIHVEFICNSGLNLNQNVFYNVSLEATAVVLSGRAGVAVKLVPESQHNYFYNCRYENIKTIDGGNSNQNYFLNGHGLEAVNVINKGRNTVQTKSKLEFLTDSGVVASFQSVFSSEAKAIQIINSVGGESGFIKGNADAKLSNTEVSSLKIANTNIFTGNQDPNGNVTANAGSLYLYTLSNASKQVWIKSSGTGTNTGWFSLQTVFAAGSTYRPTDAPIGYIYPDLTLKKLIWWDGTKWLDAMGSSV